jgi:hypothetical protein
LIIIFDKNQTKLKIINPILGERIGFILNNVPCKVKAIERKVE